MLVVIDTNVLALNDIEDTKLLELAMERMSNVDIKDTIDAEEVYKKYGITDRDIDNCDEVDFE